MTSSKKCNFKINFVKKKKFRGFRVFDFTLQPQSKTRKSQKVLFYFNVQQNMKPNIQKPKKRPGTKKKQPYDVT